MTSMFVSVLLVVAVIVAVLFAVRRRGPAVSLRRPRKRRLLTRIICGTLAAAILIAVAVGTWRQVRSCYADLDLEETTAARVPAMPVPPMPAGPLTPIPRARLLFHLVAVEARSGRARIVHLEQFELHWPEMRSRDKEITFTARGIRVAYTLRIDGLQVDERRLGEPQLSAMGEVRVRSRVGLLTSSSACGGHMWIDAQHLLQLGDVFGRSPTDRLSVVSGPPQDLVLLSFATRVAESDPLRQVTAGEFRRMHAKRFDGLLGADGREDPLARRLRGRRELPAGGVALAGEVGVPVLLLLLAAVLLTQLFTRRSLAFAGMLAAVVLYVAALDRLALSAHLSHLRDAGAPASARIAGCGRAAETFFYQDTALAAIEAVGKEPAAPPELRDVAKTAAATVQRHRQARIGK